MSRVRSRNPVGRRPGDWPDLDDELVNGVDLSRYHNRLALFFAEHAPALYSAGQQDRARSELAYARELEDSE